MNWLERARLEIQENARRRAANTAIRKVGNLKNDGTRTANTAERTLTAVMAVPPPALRQNLEGSIGSNGSASQSPLLEIGLVRDEFEERAAIMEFDGGLSRDEAEREAWALVSKRYRLH
jgi:hypothetical protein